MIEKYRAIEYLLDKLDGGTEAHCTVFRMIPGMSPDTARRRLNDYRLSFDGMPSLLHPIKINGETFPRSGWTCHKTAHIWSFTRPFLKFLKQQIKAAANLEKQNAKVKHEN